VSDVADALRQRALRADGTGLEVEQMSAVLEELFFTAGLLDQSLQKRFG
jgi:hypothetical protein